MRLQSLTCWLLLVLLSPSSFANLERLHSPPFQGIGSRKAKIGGDFVIVVVGPIGTLNPIKAKTSAAQLIRRLVMDSLYLYDPENNKYWPGLASSLSPSEKASEYEFNLRPNVRFHNGRLMAAQDVQFSFEAAVSSAFQAGHRIPQFDKIKSMKAKGNKKVILRYAKPYFYNFDIAIGSLNPVAPRDLYRNPRKKMDRVMVGSGPYKVETVKDNEVVLKRNSKWWGFRETHLKGIYNFDRIIVRSVSTEKDALALIRKNRADFFHPLGLTYFYDKSFRGKMQGSVRFVKVKNQMPKPYSFIAWNLSDPKFRDVRVRKALAHLMNRELINEKFRFGASELASGPWDKNSVYADSNLKPLDFNPEKAVDLLNEAGWLDKDLDGVREKVIDGKKVQLAFNIFLPNQNVKDYFLLYREDLNRAGVAMAVRDIDMPSLYKVIASGEFDAVSLGWGRGQVDLDPKQIWHSESAKSGGSNFIGYKNLEVDRLIDQGRTTLSQSKRVKVFRRVYKMIANDAPYLFMFHDPYEYYVLSKNVTGPKSSFRYGIGWEYFWNK